MASQVIRVSLSVYMVDTPIQTEIGMQYGRKWMITASPTHYFSIYIHCDLSPNSNSRVINCLNQNEEIYIQTWANSSALSDCSEITLLEEGLCVWMILGFAHN